ncbi:MAG: Extracellular solute-binding protein family 1 [Candidatus Azambacteria bacterium GW2011_GWA2_42_9]|nr:MAG: Extracellular solute-binding protein family 1 [Candidatus Azambacteria bacterium GW2011_GWB1_42_17]KKS45589.1 MAG: Extracellular solute-binding protein family 1 [Candidatus Azambacteria bacterium GW2011_GWA1_42_19]KKS75054.1 MAG: Extracellular solute-binding protein family 1 [Candidatus Azambacteria bacterium GW2011_GWA2_42_9]
MLIMAGAIIVIILLLASVFLGILPGSRPGQGAKTELEFWGLFDGLDVWRPIFDAYQKDNPNISFNYVQMNSDTYERDFIEALASGKRPDIIMFHSSWLPKHGNKISLLPVGLMALKEFQETFPDVATTNFVSKNQVYALPVWTDVLAMIYNKDLFNTAGIATPPKTWDEFIKVVQKLSSKDKSGNLTKSGVALGAADNINHSADILSLLMMQVGTKMTSDDGAEAAFDQSVRVGSESFLPGESALRFYTDFANPKSAVYSWNNNQHNSLDAFISGQTAVIFDYALAIPEIKKKAPNLKLGIAKMPQPTGATKAVNYADYWGYAVPGASKNSEAAWKFLIYLTRKDINGYFANTVLRPAARRDVIAEEQLSADLGVFAEEILSAVNWYQADPLETEKIFKEMINMVVLRGEKPADALSDAAAKVTFLMKK